MGVLPRTACSSLAAPQNEDDLDVQAAVDMPISRAGGGGGQEERDEHHAEPSRPTRNTSHHTPSSYVPRQPQPARSMDQGPLTAPLQEQADILIPRASTLGFSAFNHANTLQSPGHLSEDLIRRVAAAAASGNGAPSSDQQMARLDGCRVRGRDGGAVTTFSAQLVRVWDNHARNQHRSFLRRPTNLRLHRMYRLNI